MAKSNDKIRICSDYKLTVGLCDNVNDNEAHYHDNHNGYLWIRLTKILSWAMIVAHNKDLPEIL